MRRIRHACLAAGVALLAGSACAETTLNAGVRLTHDTNVNGSPTKANRLSDNALMLNASGVYFTPINDERSTYFIGQAGLIASEYNRYPDLSSLTLVGSLGLWHRLSETWSGQVTGRIFNRDVAAQNRDSDGFGATLELKKQLSETLWLKGLVDYEDSKASLAMLSNSGPTYGLNVGYLPRPDTFLNFGITHARREYSTVTPFNATANTVFIEGTQRLNTNLYLSIGYAHQDNDSNIPGTGYVNQSLSVGLQLSF